MSKMHKTQAETVTIIFDLEDNCLDPSGNDF